MSKLHPIYVALDTYQYNRAIKLASALPDSNVLGKALLAHAYFKAGQRHLSMLTLNKILSGKFCELKHAIDNSSEAFRDHMQNEPTLPSQRLSPPPTSTKRGKKGKKGKASIPTSVSKGQAAEKPEDAIPPDMLDQLHHFPSLPNHWEILPPPATAIIDETTLGTMSVTLQGLKLPLTAYQVYAWATLSNPSEMLLVKTFCLGLSVLASQSRWSVDSRRKIEAHILSHIQTVAMQRVRMYAGAKGQPTPFPAMLATAWAAQTSLWQLQWLPPDEKRNMLLPRLAESMVQRILSSTSTAIEQSQSESAEVRLLALRIFEQQSKFAEMLNILEELPCRESEGEQMTNTVRSDFGVSLTTSQIMKKKAEVLYEMEKFSDAQTIYEELLETSPDDWSCWKGHIACSCKLQSLRSTTQFVDKILEKQADSKYPLRGPHLMKVELAAQCLDTAEDPSNGASLRALALEIQRYSSQFSGRAVCAFTDLEAYVENMTTANSEACNEVAEEMLKFAEDIRKDSRPTLLVGGQDEVDIKEQQRQLRIYIFATKLSHKILTQKPELEKKWLPDSVELVNEWICTLSMVSSTDTEQSQKEVKPGDDLILLAVEQIIFQNPGNADFQATGAMLLEMAIQHSPDNAYLKMSAIRIYHKLNALSRAWELFQTMGIKHIQLDSCTFTILPFLLEGGLYNEAIDVCNALLRFQSSTARDCGDYAGRAMEGGTLSKADEFMVFQRKKMNLSLAMIEAKGIILDSAALFASSVPRLCPSEEALLKGGWGSHQGIVGGKDDMERATEMLAELHNPYAALSLVSWAESKDGCSCQIMADNRDTSILSLQILQRQQVTTKAQIGQEAQRRGRIHGILIRASLCLDAAKVPKKGKVVKPSAELQKRALSLIKSLDEFDIRIEDYTFVMGNNKECCGGLLSATIALFRVLAVISAGLPLKENDSMEERELRSTGLLQKMVLPQVILATSKLDASIKTTCSILPSFVIPLLASFRMCDTACQLYGWGKRKRKTKRCAGAMADVAGELNSLIGRLLKSLDSLPSSEDAPLGELQFKVVDAYRNTLEDQVIQDTSKRLIEAQWKTKARVEPVLQQMDEYLDSFDVNDG